MRARIVKRLPPDADKLVKRSLALCASGSRVEDRFWETKLDLVLAKIVRTGNQAALDAALDHLQQDHPDAYGALADIAETYSESFVVERDGSQYQALLVAAPVLAWTRYTIPTGALKNDTADALRTQLQAHILAAGTNVVMAPCLYSIDQLPQQHVETWQIAQQLAQAAASCNSKFKVNFAALPETAPILADPRFLLALVTAPAGAPIFRWQEEDEGATVTREQCLEQWITQGGPSFSAALPGCEFECLLPDAYYASCRNADEHIRPHTVRTAVRYLFDTLDIEPQDLRAIIAGFGDIQIDEYRVGFTRRGSNDVIYGIVWPLYGHENGESGASKEAIGTNGTRMAPEYIVTLLKEAGVTDIRRHPGRFEPEYCDDCGVPLYADSLGEIVHAEMPDDAMPAQPNFH
ncbi:DUF2863 family protein [Paraburkholderia hayleyella]|uniref:DUF2863 family protein n=1 Tax=Paraburkholderia hayleyella TaxID=2152889 RepID=UPI001291A241|nr:DUF2863 family protein [Paraburkholderia hayleyella]